MRAKVQHDADGDEARPVFHIETAEDCALAQRRLDSLKDAPRGEQEEQEFKALGTALERWHADHAAASGRTKA